MQLRDDTHQKHSVADLQRDPRQNHLLAALPSDEYQRLLPHLEWVDLKLGDSLVESGKMMRHVYFPLDCIVSLLCVMEEGDSTEIAVVGSEGIVGISLFMGGETTPSRAVPWCRVLAAPIA